MVRSFRELIDLVESAEPPHDLTDNDTPEQLQEDGLVVAGVNTTVDVKPGETARQAAKFGNAVTPDGLPPVIAEEDGEKSPLTRSPRRRGRNGLKPGGRSFKALFSRKR